MKHFEHIKSIKSISASASMWCSERDFAKIRGVLSDKLS